jgi:hypothetical protein
VVIVSEVPQQQTLKEPSREPEGTPMRRLIQVDFSQFQVGFYVDKSCVMQSMRPHLDHERSKFTDFLVECARPLGSQN